MINLEQIKNDPSSFLSLRPEDPILRKLESYRLYRAGYSVVGIAKAFNFTRPYLYELWSKFETEGAIAFIKKNWGASARKLTTKREAAIIRAKALNPEKSDQDLAQEFDVERTSVYRLLKEHGIQDLHRVASKNR